MGSLREWRRGLDTLKQLEAPTRSQEAFRYTDLDALLYSPKEELDAMVTEVWQTLGRRRPRNLQKENILKDAKKWKEMVRNVASGWPWACLARALGRGRVLSFGLLRWRVPTTWALQWDSRDAEQTEVIRGCLPAMKPWWHIRWRPVWSPSLALAGWSFWV